jgi:hypothetical protein
MALAEHTGLLKLLGEKVRITAPRMTSGSANPVPKIGHHGCGADCIEDIDVARSGR